MMREAEAHAEEDKKRREEAEVRNQAESLVYQTEKFVKENDEKLPADVKDSVNAALGEAQEASKGTNTDAIKAAMEKVATESQKIGSALYQQQPRPTGGPTVPDGAGPSRSQQARRRRRRRDRGRRGQGPEVIEDATRPAEWR